jgi:hypothetical protein
MGVKLILLPSMKEHTLEMFAEQIEVLDDAQYNITYLRS